MYTQASIQSQQIQKNTLSFIMKVTSLSIFPHALNVGHQKQRNNMSNALTILVCGSFITIGAIAIVRMAKQSKKDWAKLAALQAKSKQVNTKEEIQSLIDEINDVGSKIDNQFIEARLGYLHGYLIGRLDKFKTPVS